MSLVEDYEAFVASTPAPKDPSPITDRWAHEDLQRNRTLASAGHVLVDGQCVTCDQHPPATGDLET